MSPSHTNHLLLQAILESDPGGENLVMILVLVTLMIATWKVTSCRTGFGLQETPGSREQRFVSTPIVISIIIIITMIHSKHDDHDNSDHDDNQYLDGEKIRGKSRSSWKARVRACGSSS